MLFGEAARNYETQRNRKVAGIGWRDPARSFRAFERPPWQYAEQLGRALAGLFHDHSVGCVVSPALGGAIIGHEVARALGVRALFVERVLVIEDVWTTGSSTREAIGVVEQEGALAVAAGAIIDRSGGRIEWKRRLSRPPRNGSS